MSKLISLSIIYKGKKYDTPDAAIKAMNKQFSDIPIKALPKVKKIMDEYARRVIAAMRAKHGRPYPTGTTINTLSRRSGKGYKSWRNRTTMSVAKGEVSVKFEKVKYYNYHETGAKVRPSSKEYLAIPLPAALDDNGVPQRASLRDWEGTFVRPSKSTPGNLVVYTKLSNKRVLPIYVLTKRVEIPARLGFRDAKDTLLPLYLDKVRKEIKQQVR